MALIRIIAAKPLENFNVELTLANSQVIRRYLEPLLAGTIFAAIRQDREEFLSLRAEDGTIVWPNGADLCPDVVIWGGLPPADESSCAA